MRFSPKILWLLPLLFVPFLFIGKDTLVDLPEKPLGVVCKEDATKGIAQRMKECPVPANERGTFKGQQIAKIGSIPRTLVGKYEIEITEMIPISGGVSVFARAWENGAQIGFGKDGSVDLERFVIVNPPILINDPTGTIVRTYTKSNGDVFTENYREDLTATILQVLEQTIAVKKQKYGGQNIVGGKTGNTTLTTFPQPGTGTAPVDGYTDRGGVDEVFNTIRNGAGTAVGNSDTGLFVQLNGTASADQYSNFRRAGAGFATDSIGTDNIDSSTLTLESNGGVSTDLDDTDVDITSFSPADETILATTDHPLP